MKNNYKKLNKAIFDQNGAATFDALSKQRASSTAKDSRRRLEASDEYLINGDVSASNKLMNTNSKTL